MHRVEIRYCTGCRWLARAAWMAQELLTSLGPYLREVALVPSSKPGVFEVAVDEEVVFSRHEERGFLQPKELKRRVRDAVAPDHHLGHAQ